MHEAMVTKALDIGTGKSEREHIDKVGHITAFLILGNGSRFQCGEENPGRTQ